MDIRPVFILSISRSGSTLLQRIVAAHEGVATTSEPWILLPHAYTLRPRGVDAEYFHPLLPTAVEDFCKRLPGGESDYLEALREFALALYAKAAREGATHFVDKSPPYCLVADEIVRLFPEGKFVFLWRNPLSVMASMVETWGPWRPTFMTADLFVGLPRLLATYQANRARAHAVRFEDLVSGDHRHWRELMEYLELEFDLDSLTSFSEVDVEGRMGDPTGSKRYRELSSDPREKWMLTLANPVRREWCRRYLRFLGEERLDVMGYDGRLLAEELNAAPMSFSGAVPDLWRAVKGLAKEPIRVRTRNRRLGMPNVIRTLLSA